MPSVTPVAPAPPSNIETSNPNGMLDKDGFLRLLVGQLRQQDPMNATGTEEMMAQMTQLAMLEQVTNLTSVNEQLSARMETAQAIQLIGREVTYVKADGTAATGTVEKVEFEEGLATLTIDGESGISPADVSVVE